MNRRNLATALWFVSGWTAGAIAAALLALPSALALGPAVLAAALVRWGPGGRIWRRPG